MEELLYSRELLEGTRITEKAKVTLNNGNLKIHLTNSISNSGYRKMRKDYLLVEKNFLQSAI
jgi:hypothetical protein